MLMPREVRRVDGTILVCLDADYEYEIEGDLTKVAWESARESRLGDDVPPWDEAEIVASDPQLGPDGFWCRRFEIS